MSEATRRKMGYWDPFNTWWRDHVAKFDKRPNVHEMKNWYDINAATVWGGTGPTWEETKKHSKGMRRLEDIPDYFRKYRRGRKKKADGGLDDDSSDSDMDQQDSEGGATPQRRPNPRARANSAAVQHAAAAPRGRPRAASAAQVNAAPATFFGLPVPGLPFLAGWRARSASSPAFVLAANAAAAGLPYNVGGSAAAAAGTDLGTGAFGGVGLPVSAAAGHGQYQPQTGGGGGLHLAALEQPPPLLQPYSLEALPLHSDQQHALGGEHPGQHLQQQPPQPFVGHYMAALQEDGGAEAMAVARAGSGGGDGGRGSEGGGRGGGMGVGGGTSGGMGMGVGPLDSVLLMQVPSAALPPDMQTSAQRGMLGRLFTRNSTLKMVQSLFDRWATQDMGDADGPASPSGGQNLGTAGGDAGPSGTAAAVGVQGPGVQVYGGQYGPPLRQSQSRRWGMNMFYGQGAAPQQQYEPQQHQQHQQHQQWGYAPAQQHQQQMTAGGSGSGGQIVDGVGYVTMPHGQQQQQGYPQQQQQQAYAYPAEGCYAAQGSGGGGGLLGKRGREEAPAHAQGAAAGGGRRKLQRGLSGVLRPLLSIVSFGRRNRDASRHSGAAGSFDADGAGSDLTADTRHPGGGSRGGGGGVAASPDGGTTVGGSCASVELGAGLGLGAGLDLPSITDGAALLAGLGSALFDGLPSLADGDMLAALVAEAQATQGAPEAGAGQGGPGQHHQRPAGQEAVGEVEEGGEERRGISSISRESHLPTPFVVPEIQERVAPASYSRGTASVATVVPDTHVAPAWQPAGGGGGRGGSSHAQQFPGGQQQQLAPPYAAMWEQGQQQDVPYNGGLQQQQQHMPYGEVGAGVMQQQAQQQGMQQQGPGGQGVGGGGGSLLFRLSSTLSDYVKALHWGR